MKCSRCDAELPETATFCPDCGASTRQEPPLTFSYLPMGAPPWPTTIPQHMARAQEAASLAGSEKKKGGDRPKRSAASILAIAAVIVLVPLLGAAATLGILYLNGGLSAGATRVPASVSSASTPSTASTPNTSVAATPTTSTRGGQLPTPTSFKKTSDTNLNISLQYPSDWVVDGPQKSSDGTTLVAIHSSQQVQITFFLIRFPSAATSSFSDAHAANQANIQGLTSQLNAQDVQTVTPTNAQPVIGGTKWVEDDATFVDGNGDKIHIVTISVKRKSIYYSIVYLVPDAYFTQAMQKYIQPMLNSLQFLS
jgi:hypothetical protein